VALLDAFDRTLTPKEVVQSFFKNPAFPLVSSTDEIRRAIYELLHGGWELIDSDGIPLSISSPEQISINSINQALRRQAAHLRPDQAGPRSSEPSTDTSSGQVVRGSVASQFTRQPETGEVGPHDDDRGGRRSASSTPTQPVEYRRYMVELNNRSITSSEVREQVWQFLRELAKVIDAANPADHQLLNLTVTLTTAAGQQGQIEVKAEQAGARVRVEDDDF
jgi:hypothetical protein